MHAERILVCGHALAVALALTAALFWPRAGQAALLVPVGNADLGTVLRWADKEGAPLLRLDTTHGRVVARIADTRSLMSAVRAGILPVAAQARGCHPGATR